MTCYGKMQLRPYQRKAAQFALDRTEAWMTMDCGTGKTSVAIHVIGELLCELRIKAVLIVAPRRVCQAVWPDELESWAPWIEWTFLHGAKKDAKLKGPPKQAYLVTYEGLLWLKNALPKNQAKWPFDAIVFDESSKMKNSDSSRFRKWKTPVKQMAHRMNLSASPRANALEDLWTQAYLLDGGARLGKSITEYRSRWFRPKMPFGWEEIAGAANTVHEKVADLCYRVTNEGNLDLPECSVVDVEVKVPPDSMEKYRAFEDELVLALRKGTIDAANAGVLSNRCLQLAGGSVYVQRPDGSKTTEVFHSAKLDALKKLRKKHRDPMIVSYGYQHEADRICDAFPEATDLRKATTDKQMSDLMIQWNAGRIPMLVMHPQSGGHGLNMQKGGSVVVWYGLNWSYDCYMQLNARVWRQGQTRPCTIYRIIAENTVDESVTVALERKCKGQADFFRTILLTQNP